jgi:two-component system chemotaxis sensor kinase CheA
MNLDEALQTFILESRELLGDMENALLNMGELADQGETVNSIFRAAHTIKGSAGLFSLDHLVAFTHVVESVLDRARDGGLAFDDALVVLLLSCCDHVSNMVDILDGGNSEPDAALQRQGEPLLRQLKLFLGESEAAIVPAGEVALERIEAGPAQQDLWHISLRFGPSVLRNGLDPISFLRYLGQMGCIVGIATLPDAMPAAAEMDPELCYLGFEIAFETAVDKAAIEAVFEFVQDDCAIRIIAPRSRIEDYLRLIAELPERPARLGEILVRCGSVTARELARALDAQAGHTEAGSTIGQILVGSGATTQPVVAAALAKQKQGNEQKAQEHRSVRVDAAKLDRLIDLVGELIIAGSRADLIGQRLKNVALLECTSTLSGLVQDVRDAALELRMVKIGPTFNRFQRVVHDVAREIGKDIALVVSGEDAELDKTVVEKLGDPLLHLVRNAIDHGIEPAALRLTRGKPARGTVSLNAYHESGNIVIEVSDDGGGLKRERILAKAIERGLVDAECVMSDSDILNLIFEPGFSTAEAVTNLSGRGVGMDVVKRNITALRGSVSISSVESMGTTVTVRLPLTLAIIDGFLVQVGQAVYVIPLDTIEECIEFAVEPGQDYTNLRGQLLPFIRLRERFGTGGEAARRQSIVVVRHAGKRAGLVVDMLLGEFQTVIKPLGPIFTNVDCISGSTILGSGAVALILDVAALFSKTPQSAHPQLAA